MPSEVCGARPGDPSDEAGSLARDDVPAGEFEGGPRESALEVIGYLVDALELAYPQHNHHASCDRDACRDRGVHELVEFVCRWRQTELPAGTHERDPLNAAVARQRELPTPLDEMLAETVRVLKDAATQTKNQNVIAALDWVERIQGATRVSAHSWTCACGLLVAPTVLEPYTAKDGSVHARSGCHVSSVTARGSQRGEPTIGNAPSVDTHEHDEYPFYSQLYDAMRADGYISDNGLMAGRWSGVWACIRDVLEDAGIAPAGSASADREAVQE